MIEAVTTTPQDTTAQEQAMGMRARIALKSAGAVLTGVLLLSACGEDDTTYLDAGSVDDGTNGNGTEFDYAIAGEGSCSPYNHQNGRDAAAGEFDPKIDLVDAEVKFLGDNPDFASNMALTGESRNGYLYTAFGIDKPSSNPDKAGEAIQSIFESEFYVTAPLTEAVRVQNTYCDKEGNVQDYRVVDLEKGTYVGGAIIKQEIVTPDGKRAVELMNGLTVILPENALVVTIDMSDGNKARMLAANKAGISTDEDFEAEVGCLNLITDVPEGTPTTPPTTGGGDTTSSSTPDRSTTTTSWRTSNTVTDNTTIEGPGDGGEEDDDNESGNNTTTSTTSTTVRPGPTTTTTQATSVTSTTLGACGEECE